MCVSFTHKEYYLRLQTNVACVRVVELCYKVHCTIIINSKISLRKFRHPCNIRSRATIQDRTFPLSALSEYYAYAIQNYDACAIQTRDFCATECVIVRHGSIRTWKDPHWSEERFKINQHDLDPSKISHGQKVSLNNKNQNIYKEIHHWFGWSTKPKGALHWELKQNFKAPSAHFPFIIMVCCSRQVTLDACVASFDNFLWVFNGSTDFTDPLVWRDDGGCPGETASQHTSITTILPAGTYSVVVEGWVI